MHDRLPHETLLNGDARDAAGEFGSTVLEPVFCAELASGYSEHLFSSSRLGGPDHES